MSVRNCSECERDQNVLQQINCGFSVDKTFKRIEVLKTKYIYNICISKNLRILQQKILLSGNLM